jgi:hypothetical protein
LRPRAPRRGAARGLQGQARPQVHQEKRGTHIRATRKHKELSNVLAAMRKAAGKKDWDFTPHVPTTNVSVHIKKKGKKRKVKIKKK